MHRFTRLFCGIALSFGIASFAAAEPITDELLVPAGKIDNGLGSLQLAAQWQEPWLYATPAEKIDSGLGELPDVSRMVAVWLYAIPAEKFDSGLGELAVRAAQQASRTP